MAIGEHGWESTTNPDEKDLSFGKRKFLENADKFLTGFETVSSLIGVYPTGEAMKTVLAKSLLWRAKPEPLR